jgi:adenosylmethionine-8-amino-7-oxononanoate aminotransferase
MKRHSPFPSLLEAWDKAHLWHPFTQMSQFLQEKPLIIKEAKGVILKDIYGNEYLDGVSSLWCNIHGHRKKAIDKAIKAQLKRVAHSTLLGASNIPSILLAKRLAEIAPTGAGAYCNTPLLKVFYSDDGSTAVEVALKMAFQYWCQTDHPEKKKFLALQYAYHGDTLGAVAVGGIMQFHHVYRPLTFCSTPAGWLGPLLSSTVPTPGGWRVPVPSDAHVLFAPSPYCYRCPLGKDKETCGMACLEEMERLLAQEHNEIAALIIEPLVQGAGGMIVHPKGYLKGVRELCDKYNVLLIADEVLTGFGRTGKLFACEHEGVVPDIMALSKGLTAGYLPLAATLTTERIYSAFLGDYTKTLFHGHTYTGNPLACAAALACLEVFEKESVLKNLQPKIELLENRLKDFYELEHVGEVRQCGLIAGIELVKDRQTKEPYPPQEKIGHRVVLEARKRGALLRPLGHVIVIMPPLAISHGQLARLTDIVYSSIRTVTEG